MSTINSPNAVGAHWAPMTRGGSYVLSQVRVQCSSGFEVLPQVRRAHAPAAGDAGAAGDAWPAGKSGGNKNLPIIIGAAVAVVAVVLILVFVVFKPFGGGGTSPEGVAKEYIEARLRGDVDKILSLSSSDIRSVSAEQAYDGDEDEMRDSLEDAYDSLVDDFDDLYGDDWAFEVEVEDVDEYDEDEVENIADNFESMYDEKIDLEGAAEVEVSWKILDSDGDEQEDSSTTVNLIKQNGKWYTLSF